MNESTVGRPLRIRHLTYRYPGVRRDTLADVSFDLPAGTVTGLFGRNGVGKTTLMYLAAGLARPSGGTIRVGETDPFADPSVAVLMSAGRCLAGTTLGRLAEVWAAQRAGFQTDLAMELLDRFEVDPRRRPGQLSQGQRACANLAFALASRAPLTLLDEIHLGLDPVIRRRIYDTILDEFLASGATFLIASHAIEDVEPLISAAIIMRSGRVVRAGDADDLRASVPGARSLTDVMIALETEEPQ
ncbi:MAG: ABC transporter ATP-binding protein [Bowdeniella nasicola]|nr:ABC transporter ATP-binding protein [Bowdeniella nasicola]